MVLCGLMDADARAHEFSRLVAVELANEARIRKVRQRDVALAAGITPEHFSHTVNGRKGLLTVGVLLRAAERIGVEPKVIVERAYARLLKSAAARSTTPARQGRPSTPKVVVPRARASSREPTLPSPPTGTGGPRR